jgi:multiple sugar transport system permease protein
MSVVPTYDRRSPPVETAINLLTILLSAVWLSPFFWMISTAMKSKAEIFTSPPSWLPAALNFDNFIAAWNAAPFATYYFNSFLVAAATTVLTLLIASMGGYALARLPFPGRSLIIGGMLTTTIIPFQVLLIPFFILMTALKLVNSPAGLVLAYVAIILPFAVFMFRAYFMDLPREIEESARIDGCSWLGVYWRIALPTARPAIAAVGIYTFIESWNEFFIALIMTSNDALRTLPVGLAMFNENGIGISWGELMASSITATVPAIVVFLLMQRQLIAGLTGGAVKG